MNTNVSSILLSHKLWGKSAVVALASIMLAGCWISPYYGQKFSSRSNSIPFTVWTISSSHPIVFECAKASAHGGPQDGVGSYQHLATVWPEDQGVLDPDGAKVYTASTSKVIPEGCWRYYDYSDDHDYITVVRALQNGSDSLIQVFDKPGLACLGQWVGQTASWLGHMGHSCNKKYSNTGGTIRTVFLKAKY